MNELIIASRAYREKIMEDPIRPAYHFTIPDGKADPGDPNGAFFADGVYHLMYLYHNAKTDGYHWGHVSSVDLLHWRHHPDALTVGPADRGCYSGGAFLDDDGTAYLTFWKFPDKDNSPDKGGIAIAKATAPYEKWERLYPIAIESNSAGELNHFEGWGSIDKGWGSIDIAHDGILDHVSCADPSNIWKQNGWYYLQAGNKHVLDVWGREEDSDPRYRGDWTDLFRSKDLKTWSFVHRFYTNPHSGEDWPDATEDDMCPSFLPLYDAKENGMATGKWLQLFISHNKGCQYYVGTLNDETFYPQTHGRMSWNDNGFFAPEALIDDRNRHIMWSWMLTTSRANFKKYGWCGVYSFPRVLWWEDDQLHMAPAQELDRLQLHHQSFSKVKDGVLPVKNGKSFRLKATFDMTDQKRAGLRVKVNSAESSYVEICVDKEKNQLIMDAVDCEVGLEKAPFALKEGELLSLDIFVDRAIVEVYANERQAICRYVYPADPEDAVGVRLCGDPVSVDAWEMAPSNPY